MAKRKTILGVPKCGHAATCATSAPTGCSAPNCPICDMPFEYGDIRIGEKDGIQFCYYCAARAAKLFETLDAVIGKVTPCAAGWNVAFAPDCTTWVTVRRDEHAEPKVGNFITVTVPKVVQIHSQPNNVLSVSGERKETHE